ncbi:MAG: methyltransferase domain-containing protein [Bacteroidetes bacterium]|nr:methyltransferase domain-containing protein [Bacteroidota bacterium]
MSQNSLHRFSDRVDNYVRYRPHYPEAAYAFMETAGLLNPGACVADIGSGTGISAKPLLERGYRVTGIEPNADMRHAAESMLSSFPNFKSLEATAENTSLPDQSIDMILAGQAFHWFDRERSRVEFKRILKPGASVVLMWNDRRTDTSDFLKVYEDFLQMFGTDYKEINHKNTQEKQVFDAFFGGSYKQTSFYNFQDVDFAGLKGRVLSSSYMPNEGHKDYDFMIYCLKKIFTRYQQNGLVRLDYDTQIYYAPLN